MKRRMVSAGIALLTIVSGLCLAGLKAIDKKLEQKKNCAYRLASASTTFPPCHCEERSDVAIRSLIAGLLGDGLPHQSADWFAMTGKLNQADTHKKN